MLESGKRLRILVTDTQELAGLGAVRSLGQAGHRIVAGFPAGSSQPPVAWSRYCKATVSYPDPWRHNQQFQEWLAVKLNDGEFDAVLPITEAAMVAVSALRPEFAGRVLLLLPGEEHLRYALSKYAATEKALEGGVPCPETIFLPDHDRTGALADLERLGFPLVIKIDNYMAAGGEYKKGTHFVARDKASAARILREIDKLPTRGIAQRFIEGHGAGAFFLRFGGKTHLQFVHRRVHEVPYTGGISSLRQSARDEDLVSLGKRMLDVIGYEGVAMVEFRREPRDGKCYFLEVNGRFWGSLALALHAGVDFPKHLLECYRFGTPIDPPPSYTVGIRCRNVLSGEIQHLGSIFQAKRGPGGAPSPSRGRALAEFFLLFLDPRIRHDHLWWSDPLPAVLKAAQSFTAVLRKSGDRASAKLSKKLLLWDIKWGHGSRRFQRPFFQSPLSGILFVCYGNICRSPFAEYFWNERLRGEYSSLPIADSVGTAADTGSSSPNFVTEIGAEFGIKLDSHRAKRLDASAIRKSDAIFAMDLSSYRDVLSAYPEARERTFLLGLFAGKPFAEIDDPYLMNESDSRRSYDSLVQALDGLAACILDQPVTSKRGENDPVMV